MIEETHPTFERIFEMLGDTPMPAPFEEYARVPAFLQDFCLNFKRFVWNDGFLDTRLKAAVAFAVSVHLRCEPWSQFFSERLRKLGMNDTEIDELRAIVSTVSMFNTFYRFQELSGNPRSAGTGVRLRGHSLDAQVGAQLTELVAAIISGLNSCHTCTAGHVREALGRLLTEGQMAEAIQCAATIVAGCTFLSR